MNPTKAKYCTKQTINKTPYKIDKKINIVDRVIHNIRITLRDLKVMGDKTVNSLLPQENIVRTTSITKNIIGKINKTTPNPFSIPFKLLINPYPWLFKSLGFNSSIVLTEAVSNIAFASSTFFENKDIHKYYNKDH